MEKLRKSQFLLYQMVPNTQGNGWLGRKLGRERANSFGQMGQFTKDGSRITKLMAKGG